MCKCHHPRSQHVETGCVSCRMNGIDLLANHRFIGPDGSEEPKPQNYKHRCRNCGHIKGVHVRPGGSCDADWDACDCVEFVCDHSRCGWKPREECQHPNAYNYGFASGPPAIRYFYCSACKAKWETEEQPEEPPLTPEEEEQAPEDSGCANESGCYRQHTDDCKHGCRHAADELTRLGQEMEPPPPQPDRRPPYAVAYSVQGHLYEVALSGDATVKAVDGALVIQHHLGPVAGIVQVLPVINKEEQG